MPRRPLLALLILGLSCILSAGPQARSVLGKWTIKEMSGLVVEYQKNGTLTANMVIPEKPPIIVFTSSTWTLKGNKLTTVGKSLRVSGGPAETRKMMEKAGRAELGKKRTGTITWKSKDEFVVSGDSSGAHVTYVRKKR